MFKLSFVLAALHWSGFSCTRDSDASDSGSDAAASSGTACSSDDDCTETDEVCYTDYECTEDDDDSCVDEYGDYACHLDCTEESDCASGEACYYVGDNRWLCLDNDR
jgi:hypothetical protein